MTTLTPKLVCKTPKTATAILLLHLAGKISPTLKFNFLQQSPSPWSRKIRSTRRVPSQIPKVAYVARQVFIPSSIFGMGVQCRICFEYILCVLYFFSVVFTLHSAVASIQKQIMLRQASLKRISLRQAAVSVIDTLDEFAVPFIPWSGTLLGFHRDRDIILGDSDADFAIHYDNAKILFTREIRLAFFKKGHVLTKSALNVWKIYSTADMFENRNVTFEELPEYFYCTSLTKPRCEWHVDLFIYANTSLSIHGLSCLQRGCFYPKWRDGYEQWYEINPNVVMNVVSSGRMSQGCPSESKSLWTRIPHEWLRNTTRIFIPSLRRNVAIPKNTLEIMLAVFGSSWNTPSKKRGHRFRTPCSPQQ